MTSKTSVFLHGPTRSGKTTALKRIDGYLSTQGINVLRFEAEDLAIQLVKSIRDTGDTSGFWDKLDDCDALLVDNIWVLQGRPRTTEEIFLSFNRFLDEGKFLVITWDIPFSTLSCGSKAVTKLSERSVTVEMKPSSGLAEALTSVLRDLSSIAHGA